MSNEQRMVSTRRNLQQLKHCIEEALAVVEREEDVRCAVDDLEHASGLLKTTLGALKADMRTHV